MANINFPSSPIAGQQYTFLGTTYIYTSSGMWSTSAVAGVRPGLVGDVRWGFDSTPLTWERELNGQTITNGLTLYAELAARYPAFVSGSDIILPDARGRFPRIWAHGSGYDPDRATRTGGDTPASLQDYTNASHHHSHAHSHYHYHAHPHSHTALGPVDGTLAIPSGAEYSYGNPYWLAVTGDGAVYDATTDATVSTVYSGGNESRPYNINFSAFMRII